MDQPVSRVFSCDDRPTGKGPYLLWGPGGGKKCAKSPVLPVLPSLPFSETTLLRPAGQGVDLNLLRGGEGMRFHSFYRDNKKFVGGLCLALSHALITLAASINTFLVRMFL
jgi:hypothetical protein